MDTSYLRGKMSENKKTVGKYIDGFNKSDHGQILSCLIEDIEWEMPGVFHLYGKESFDKEINNEAFVGNPTVTIIRMTEENDVVVAEGEVHVKKKDGNILHAKYCDVFIMKNAKIRQLISYFMETK